MTQRELNREVARLTGESVSAVRSFGFSLADPLAVHHDPEPCHDDRYLDWDEVDRQRHLLLPVR